MPNIKIAPRPSLNLIENLIDKHFVVTEAQKKDFILDFKNNIGQTLSNSMEVDNSGPLKKLFDNIYKKYKKGYEANRK